MLPARLASVLAQNHTRVLDLFRATDTNRDGEISRSELARLLRKLGIEFSQEELAQLFVTLDPDQSGGIDFHELQRALRVAVPLEMHPRSSRGPSPSRQSSTSLRGSPAPRPESALHLHQGPPNAEELRLLEEMINEADAATRPVWTPSSAYGSKRAGSPGGTINLVRVLSAYEVVLRRHGLVPVEDTRYYHLVLQMSLLPQPDWRAKLAAMCGSMRPAHAQSTAMNSNTWDWGRGDPRASPSLPGTPIMAKPSMQSARPPNSSPYSSPTGYGAIHHPSELAMRIGMLACDAQSPAMQSQAKHLRAALHFDVRRMTPEEAEAYARFRLCAVMFRAWHALASESASAERVFKMALARWVSAVSHWEKRLCQQCVVGWADWVGHLRRVTHGCAGLAARNSMQRHWYAFRVAYRQSNLEKQKLIAALAHWGLRLAIAIFAGWRNVYVVASAGRVLLSSGAVHHRTMALEQAFRIWRGRNAQGAEYQRKAFLLASSHSVVVRQVMLVAWRAHTALAMQLRWHVVDTLRLTRLRHLLAAWRACDRREKQDRHKVSAALCRMRKRGLVTGFVSWRACDRREKQDRHKVSAALCRMRKRGLVMGFVSWLAAVEKIASDRATLVLCLRRCILRSVSAALRAWVTGAKGHYQLQDAALQVLQKCKRLAAARGLQAWREAAQKWEHFVDIGMRISGKTRMLLLGDAIIRWLGSGDEQTDREAKLRRSLACFAHRVLATAWRGLQVAVLRGRKLRRSLACSAHRLLVTAWRGLQAAVLRAAELRCQLLPYASRLANRLASLSFEAWLRFLDYRHAHRDDSRAAAVHRARTLAGRHLRTWRGAHEKFNRAARHMFHGVQSRALASWREYTGSASRKLDLMRNAMRSMRSRELRAATVRHLAPRSRSPPHPTPRFAPHSASQPLHPISTPAPVRPLSRVALRAAGVSEHVVGAHRKKQAAARHCDADDTACAVHVLARVGGRGGAVCSDCRFGVATSR